MVRGGLVHERCGVSREDVGHLAPGLALQDSLWEEGDAAGTEISFGARSGRCAGFRDVVTRAWPVSSYFCEWIVRGLRGRPAGSFGAAGLGLDPNRRGFFPSSRLLQLLVDQVKTVCELGRREEDCAAVL